MAKNLDMLLPLHFITAAHLTCEKLSEKYLNKQIELEVNMQLPSSQC